MKCSLSGFSRRLHKELVEGLPQNGVRVGLFFDSLAVDLMSELASRCTQLFEAVIQCVRAVVGLVNDSAMLKRETAHGGRYFGGRRRGVQVRSRSVGCQGSSRHGGQP